jgi:hypothetical protein
MQKAREANGNKQLTTEQRTKYDALAKQLEDAQKKLLEYEEAKSNNIANVTVAKLKNEVARERRQTKRTYKKEELDIEFKSLVNELNTALGGLHVGIDPTGVLILGKMAKNRVHSGIITVEGIVDSIYTETKNIGLELSKREIRDAISGYGKTILLSKKEIDVKMRDLRHQMRLTSALEDAQKKQAPLRSGLQRDIPSDTVRALQRQVQQVMKEQGIDSGSLRTPEQAWKTSLDAVKTRLKNQIHDIEKQLITGEKTPKKLGIKYDEHATSLKGLRDTFKEILVAVEGKQEMSPEQRIKIATTAAEKSIAELERRINEKDLTTQKKVSKTPETVELKALREKRDKLRAVYNQMKDDARPRKTSEGDFTPRELKTVVPDRESITLQFSLENAKRKFNEELIKDQLKNRNLAQKAKDTIIETFNLSRSIMTSFDLSAVLRQGGFISFGHPIRALKNFPDMLRALMSEKMQMYIENEIKKRPNYHLYKKHKLFLSEHGVDLKTMEEAYMSRHASKLPGVGASQRAYTTFLNKLRADSFDAMLKELPVNNKKPTPKEIDAIANFVNVATGRGSIGGKEHALVGLNSIFFAPRLVASRLNILGGQPFYRGTARSRYLVAKEYARFLIGAGTVYTLAKMMGAEVEIDPRSSDFGKIKIGNTRLDPMAGLSQVTTLTARVLTGKTKTLGGDIKELRGEDVEYGSGDTWEVIARFLRTKLNPATGAMVNIATGRDVVGKPATAGSVTKELFVPMTFGDIYDAMKEQGIPPGAALSILATFGMGLQTYEER